MLFTTKKKIVILSLVIFVSIFFYINSIKYDLTIIGRVNVNDSMSSQPVTAIKLYRKYLDVNAISIRKSKFKDMDFKTILTFFKGNQLGKFVLLEDTVTEKNAYDNVYDRLIKNQIIKRFKKKDQIWIAYSMFESTKIPQIWVSTINKFFDMVVVPDPYFIDVYKNSGVKVPIFFVPLATELSSYLALPIKKERNKIFTFMNLSAGRNNKNQIKLVQAFNKVNKLRPDTQLIINSRFVFPEIQSEIINYIRSSDTKNVQYTTGTLPRSDYIELIKQADSFVYPSRGEGFSFQPREAMALGVPTIVTNNTAQKTICNSGFVECVESKIERSAYYDIWHKVVVGNDFDCEIEDLVKAMLNVYDNYQSYLNKSEQMRVWAAQYSNLDDLYISMIKPKKIILGKQNLITKDYLETNSKELYEKYKS